MHGTYNAVGNFFLLKTLLYYEFQIFNSNGDFQCEIENIFITKLPSSAQAPVKPGWVATFSANPTTHPPRKVYFPAGANLVSKVEHSR